MLFTSLNLGIFRAGSRENVKVFYINLENTCGTVGCGAYFLLAPRPYRGKSRRRTPFGRQIPANPPLDPAGLGTQIARMSDLETILDLERRVWQALADGDTSADQALLAEDFLGVYSTGFSDRAGHVGQLAAGPSVQSHALSAARLMPLGAGRVLLAYRADFTRVGRSAGEAMYVSSIWERRNGRWLNTFSQDSAVGDPAPV